MNAPARAERLVLGWARRYTRRLPEEVAERRLLELESDTFEQRRRGREVGANPTAVAVSMAVRTLAGVPADLLWRHTQITAVSQGQPLHEGGRPMGRWMKDNWWVVLGGLISALTTVLGVALPFEDQTLGSVVGGSVIAVLGVVGLLGAVVRARPGRRSVGDLMLVAGQLPWIPFFWTIVPPILALTVIVAAFIDISDASATGNESVGRADGRAPDRATPALLVALVAAVAGAVVTGDPSFALTIPVPLAILLLLHLSLGRRLSATPLVRAGTVLAATPLLWFFAIIGIGLYEDGYTVEGRYEYIVEVGSVVMMFVGIGLVIGGVRRGRQARPA